DHIVLSQALEQDLDINHDLGGDGQLNAKYFYTGSEAHDWDDRIIYNRETGDLLYDPDGVFIWPIFGWRWDDNPAVKIAQLAPNLDLSAQDFVVTSQSFLVSS